MCNSVAVFVIPSPSYTELWQPSKTNILSIAMLFHLVGENEEEIL